MAARADKNTKERKPKGRRGAGSRILRGLMMFVDVVAVLALALCGYAGTISPLKYGGIWGIFGLAFPIVLITVLALAVLQLFVHRRGLWVLGLGMLACAGPILTYSPVHIGRNHRQHDPADSTFTFMAYNVANIKDMRPAGTYDSSYNATISYILRRQPDIVSLTEAKNFCVNPAKNTITPAQMDSVHRTYPHVLVNTTGPTLLSKYPAEPIHLNIDPQEFRNAELGAYRITLPGGKLLTLFCVHLQSLALTADDRSIYRGVTDLQPDMLGDFKSRLLAKVSYANVQRARQAKTILGLVRHYGGPNVIIAGDFNDVPGCYTIRSFEDAGFSNVYGELGFGPMITFNKDRFWFQIDHIMYRGHLRPLWIEKGDNRSSDHYPLEAEFAVSYNRYGNR